MLTFLPCSRRLLAIGRYRGKSAPFEALLDGQRGEDPSLKTRSSNPEHFLIQVTEDKKRERRDRSRVKTDLPLSSFTWRISRSTPPLSGRDGACRSRITLLYLEPGGYLQWSTMGNGKSQKKLMNIKNDAERKETNRDQAW